MIKLSGFFCGTFLAVGCLFFSAAALSPGHILSGSAVLMDADTGQVLFDKNMHGLAYPASTTKIMTALLVSELCDPGELVTVSNSALDIDEWDSANMALIEGEQLPVDSALYGLMLPSANDAANALAEHAAGSQERFAERMNQRAWQLGARDTHFTNAHGLHDPSHYTTAYDMAVITRSAIQNPTFLQYFGAAIQTIPATNLQPVPRPLVNYHLMLVRDSVYYDPSVLGGKVGYTNEAGHTMSTVARKDGRTLVCVVMNSASRADKFIDTGLLLQYGFEEFRRFTLPADAFAVDTLPVGDGAVSFHSNRDFTALLHRDLREDRVRVDFRFPAAFRPDEQLPTSVEVVVDVPDDDSLPSLLGVQPLVADLTLGDSRVPVTPAIRMLSFPVSPDEDVPAKDFHFPKFNPVTIALFCLFFTLAASGIIRRRLARRRPRARAGQVK